MFYFFTNVCSCHLEIEEPIWLQSYVCHAFLLVMLVYPMVLVVACSDGNSSGVGTGMDVLTRLKNWGEGVCTKPILGSVERGGGGGYPPPFGVGS